MSCKCPTPDDNCEEMQCKLENIICQGSASRANILSVFGIVQNLVNRVCTNGLSPNGDTITTLTNNGDGTISYINETGDVEVIAICDLISDAGCSDSLVDTGDGKYTHTALDGTQTIIDTTADNNTTYTVTNNNDGSFVLTGSDNTSETIQMPVTTVTDTITGNPIATIDNSIDPAYTVNETVTTFVDNNNGTYTYTNEAGTTFDIDVKDDTDTTYVLSENNDGTITLTGSDSTTQTLDICAIIANNCPETVTSLTISGTDILFTDENNTVNTIAIPQPTFIETAPGIFEYTPVGQTPLVLDTTSTPSTITNTVTGHLILTHDNGDGTSTDVNETITSVTYNGTTGELTYKDETGADNVITLPLENFLSTASFDPTTNELTLTLSDNSTFTVDLAELMDTYELVTTNTDSVTTTLSGNGSTATPWDVSSNVNIDPSATNIATITSGGLLVEETVTSLVLNVDGTYTYTSEDGTQTKITNPDICTMLNTISDGGAIDGDKILTIAADGACKLVDMCAEDLDVNGLPACTGVLQNSIVSPNADNIIQEDANKLAYLETSDIVAPSNGTCTENSIEDVGGKLWSPKHYAIAEVVRFPDEQIQSLPSGTPTAYRALTVYNPSDCLPMVGVFMNTWSTFFIAHEDEFSGNNTDIGQDFSVSINNGVFSAPSTAGGWNLSLGLAGTTDVSMNLDSTVAPLTYPVVIPPGGEARARFRVKWGGNGSGTPIMAVESQSITFNGATTE